MSLIKRRYPNNLYALRRLRGYQQKALARLLGQKGTYMVSAYERGLAFPPLHTVVKLTMILGAELPELYPQLHRQVERELITLVATLPRGTRRPVIGRQKGEGP
jgi:transcriptional regulator with XRE-family HTH domain